MPEGNQLCSECQTALKSSTHMLHCVLRILDFTHTDFGYAKYEQPVSNASELLQVWFDYRTVVKGQTGAGFNACTSHNYWLPVEALAGLLTVCRNVCAALGANDNGAVVFPSPHLHVELDLKEIVGIIKSISSIVSYSVIIIKRC